MSNYIRREDRVPLLAILALVLVTLIPGLQEPGFWPQLSATLIGALFGIPAGLWANRLVARRTDEKEADRIVSWLKTELEENLRAVAVMTADFRRRDYPAVMGAVTKLRDSLWRSVSNTGKVGTIRSADLVQRLADAYESVSLLRLLADLFFRGDEFVRIPGKPGFEAPFDNLWWRGVEEAEKRLRNVLAVIEGGTR